MHTGGGFSPCWFSPLAYSLVALIDPVLTLSRTLLMGLPVFTHIGVFTYTDLPLGRVGSATGLGSQFWGATAHCSCLLLEVGSWRGLCEGSFHCIPFYFARFIDILVHLVLTCSLLCNAVPYDANWTCACCSSVLHFRHTHTRMHAYS